MLPKNCTVQYPIWYEQSVDENVCMGYQMQPLLPIKFMLFYIFFERHFVFYIFFENIGCHSKLIVLDLKHDLYTSKKGKTFHKEKNVIKTHHCQMFCDVMPVS